jgi:type IV pilus assembly protein PilB
MEVRLGQLLIEAGVLTTQQVQRIVAEQHRTGTPFGLLSEQMFGIDPDAIEQAWALQYASMSREVDPQRERIEPQALSLVTRRQAWQFRILPMRFDDGELMMATTQQHLRRALRFATAVMGVPVFLVLTSPQALGEALCRHYPLPGMTPHSVNDDAMDRLLKA